MPAPSAAANWLTPAAAMPWPVRAPFRMQPNLGLLEPSQLLLRDTQAEAYRQQKVLVLQQHRERTVVGRIDDTTLHTIAQFACPDTDTEHLDQLALQLQEDFVVLRQDEDGWLTELLCVCFPSRWDPREKVNANFTQIHAPVADNERLLAAAPGFMKLAFATQSMLRHVWLLSPSAQLAQHPEQNDASWQSLLESGAPLLDQLYWRIERQTTWPLPALGRAVFFIRILTAPLREVMALDAARPAELAIALRSMTPAVLAYRGMQDALPRLLAELDALSA